MIVAGGAAAGSPAQGFDRQVPVANEFHRAPALHGLQDVGRSALIVDPDAAHAFVTHRSEGSAAPVPTCQDTPPPGADRRDAWLGRMIFHHCAMVPVKKKF